MSSCGRQLRRLLGFRTGQACAARQRSLAAHQPAAATARRHRRQRSPGTVGERERSPPGSQQARRHRRARPAQRGPPEPGLRMRRPDGRLHRVSTPSTPRIAAVPAAAGCFRCAPDIARMRSEDSHRATMQAPQTSTRPTLPSRTPQTVNPTTHFPADVRSRRREPRHERHR